VDVVLARYDFHRLPRGSATSDVTIHILVRTPLHVMMSLIASHLMHAHRGVVARAATSGRKTRFASSRRPPCVSPRTVVQPKITSVPRRFAVLTRASTSSHIADLGAKTVKATVADPVIATILMPASFGAVLASSFAFPALWAFAAVPCCLAFLNPVYVFSVGYGLSVAAQGVGIFAMLFSSGVWVPTTCVAHVLGSILYGTRLGVFLYHRSVTWKEWNARAKNAPEAKAQTFSSKVAVIALCSLLYAMMCSPMLWHARVANTIPGDLVPVTVIGLAAQWIGFLLESVADHQKSAHKKSLSETETSATLKTTKTKNPWCDIGTYRRCRHPNYLGEILFWVGLFLAGVPAMLTAGWWSFVPATLGMAFIVKLMMSQCAKQDEKQRARYGEDANYAEWVERTGSVFPKLQW